MWAASSKADHTSSAWLSPNTYVVELRTGSRLVTDFTELIQWTGGCYPATFTEDERVKAELAALVR